MRHSLSSIFRVYMTITVQQQVAVACRMLLHYFCIVILFLALRLLLSFKNKHQPSIRLVKKHPKHLKEQILMIISPKLLIFFFQIDLAVRLLLELQFHMFFGNKEVKSSCTAQFSSFISQASTESAGIRLYGKGLQVRASRIEAFWGFVLLFLQIGLAVACSAATLYAISIAIAIESCTIILNLTLAKLHWHWSQAISSN